MLLVDKKENTKRQLCQFRDRIFVFSADCLVSATRSVEVESWRKYRKVYV